MELFGMSSFMESATFFLGYEIITMVSVIVKCASPVSETSQGNILANVECSFFFFFSNLVLYFEMFYTCVDGKTIVTMACFEELQQYVEDIGLDVFHT